MFKIKNAIYILVIAVALTFFNPASAEADVYRLGTSCGRLIPGNRVEQEVLDQISFTRRATMENAMKY